MKHQITPSGISHTDINQSTLLIDIATRNVVRLAPADSVWKAARLMAGKRISSIVVTDAEGRPVGIVTERNMLHAMQSGCLPGTALREIMTSPVITMPESITCLDAYQVCQRDGIRHLVIVDTEQRLLGVVSETDFYLHINLATLAGHRQIASIMSRSVFSLPPEARLQEALNLMHLHRDTCVVVADGQGPLGIVTERDIVRLYSGKLDPAGIPLKDVMTSPVLTVLLDNTINEAAGLMLKARVRHLVVVDHAGRVAGLVSEHGLTQTITMGLIDSKLNAEGAFLHTLVSTIPDMIWLKDVNGVYMACNPRFERFFGAKEQDIVGKTDYDFVGKELADFFREHDCAAMERDRPSVNEEWVTFADDGHRELLETIKTPMHDGTGRLIGVLGIARDITARMKAEEELRKLSAAVEQSAASVVITDLEARIQYVNPHFTESTGYSAAEAIGQNPRILQSGQTSKETYRELWGTLTGGQKWNGELLNKRKNGELYWEDVSIAPIKDSQGDATHFVAVKTEITGRKKMEAALAESEHRYRTLFENSPFCIHEIDLQGRLQSMNHAGLDMFGLDEEKKNCGVPYLSVVSSQDSGRIKALLQDAINGSPSHFEFAAAGDTPRYFKSCFIPIKDVCGKVIKLMGIMEDITERKRIEEALYFVAQRGWQDRSENYFDALAQYLGKSLGVDYVVIDRLGADPDIAETIALYAKGSIIPNMRYSLRGTPCESVMGHDFCYYRSGVQQLFPDDAMLEEMGVAGYAGIPLWDSTGRALGLIAVMDCKPLPDKATLSRLLSIVATRAAAELERKLSEDRLREQKEFLASIFENALDAVMLMNSEGIITGWSKQAERIFGWSHDEAIGRLLHETIVPVRYREQHLRGMQHFIATGEGPALNTRIEISALHRDGREFPVELSISPIKTEHGYEFSSFIRDISERKRLERQLTESEKLFRAVFEQASSAVELVDADTLRFIEINPAACRMLGYTHEEYLRLRLTDTQADLDEAALLVLIRQLEASGGATFESHHRCKNGDILDVEISARMLDLPGRRTLVGVWRDITEKKLAEKNLRENEAKYRQLFEAAGDGIFIQDASGFIDCNEKGASLYGLSRAEVISRHPSELAPERQPDGRLSADFAGEQIAAALEGKSRQFEWQALRADGTTLDVEITLGRIELNGSVRLQAVVRDISLRKQAEEMLRKQKQFSDDVINSLPGIFYMLNQRGNFVRVNPRFLEVSGYSQDEIAGMHALDFFGLADRNVIEKRIGEVFEAGESWAEAEFITKSGQNIPYYFSGRRTEIDGEHYLVGLGADIAERKRTEVELRRLSEAIRQCSEAIVLADMSLHFQYVNPAFEKLFGYSLGELQGRDLSLLLPDAPAKQAANHIENASFEGEKLRRAKDGRNIPILLKVAPFRGEDGEVVGFIGAMTDITERKRAEENLRITASVFDNSQEAIVITDANNIITDVNKAFTNITGYSREEALGRNPSLLSSGRQSKAFYAEMWQSLNQKHSWRGEIWNRRKSGDIYAELLSISVIKNDDGCVQRYVGIFSDISYLKEHEAELSRVAHYDALTGIPNRVLLADRMRQAIAQTSRDRNMMAVCYLDLDSFKPINDTLGHDAGDQVLVEISRRIGKTIRGGDTVARLGGDEFVVLLLGLDRGEECVVTLERLLAAIAQPIIIKNRSQTLGASIGVSIYPLDDEDPDTLLRHADQAMYVAKQSGKNRFYIYDPTLDQRARSHREFIDSVGHALENNQFELYYQPKINLRTKRMVGVEALIRWHHPKRGLLCPAEFLRPIEKSELDIATGDWVISTALAQIDRWRQAGLDIEVSINISAHHLESPRFAEKLRQHLVNYPGMPPGRLQIEVLETAALNDIVVVREVIEACRKFGVGFALDDFGTGYSSLSYLSSLPVDALKIDQSFVRDMLDDKGDMAIVQGVIALARAFDLQTVAEGVETGESYRALLDMGCEVGQGYHIAYPMTADALINWHPG